MSTVAQQKGIEERGREERDWRVILRDILLRYVKEDNPYRNYVDEFIGFVDRLYNVWWNGDPKIRNDYAYHMALIMADSEKTNVVRAKVNSFYAYLVYRGYVSAYRLMKDKYVAGGESIYTWLRMYRKVMG